MQHLVAALVIMALVLAPGSASGQDAVDHVVYLRDGTVLPGRVVEETDDTVVLLHATLGQLEIDRTTIERVEELGVEDPRPDWKSDPSYNSILLAPTPATLPKGTGYFRSIELFLLNFGYAPTDNFNLAIGTIFPLTDEFIGIMAGAKLRIVDREEHLIGLALTGSYTYLDELTDDALWSAGAVVGIGDSRKSMNLSVGGNFSGSDSSLMLMLGADAQVGARTKVIAEFGNTSADLFNDEDFNGLMNIGLRFFGDSMSFTLTGFRPLGESSGLFLFPLAVFSINF